MKTYLLKEIKNFKERLKRNLKNNFVELRIFGSRVRGNYNFWSDLDILIVVKKKNKKIEKIINDLSWKFTEELGYTVHTFVLDEKEWREKQNKTIIGFSILKHGVKV